MRLLAIFVLTLFVTAQIAAAQDRRLSHCIAIAENAPGLEYLHKASWSEAVSENSVRITYVSHATFLIQSDDGLSIATDYTGFPDRTTLLPDVVTMNRAHDTHWTPNPDPDIGHVLRGWGATDNQPADHHLELGEVLIRNVPTDIRSRFGGAPERNGNSIFVFEIAGLCIGHLGHLHHEPDEAQYAALGRLDVVMAPVDGGLTLDLPTMIKVLSRVKASVVIPMHWFSTGSLDTFLLGMSELYRIDRSPGVSMTVSLRDLPDERTIRVLAPGFMRQ